MEVISDEPCRARGCADNAVPCARTPTAEIRAGGFRTFLCSVHMMVEKVEAEDQGAHSKARCRNHAYDEESLPGMTPAPCNWPRAAREGRPVWGWEVMR